LKLFLFLCVLWTSPSWGDTLVGPKQKTCAQSFQEFYLLLDKGMNPYLGGLKNCPREQTLLTWLWLVKHDRHATFDDYRVFIKQHPNWPLLDKIQEGGENLMTLQTDSNQVLAFFSDRAPLTSLGMTHYVRAFLDTSQKTKAIKALKTFWQMKNFSASNERFFYQRFKPYLTPTDHTRRLERLILEDNYYGLKRMMPRVSKREQLIIQAALALIQKQTMADFYLKKLTPQERNHIGIIYQRLKWRLNKGKKKEALDLFLEKEKGTHIKGWPAHWFKYRYYFSRLLFKEKRYQDVYSVLKKHGLNPLNETELTDYAAAEWFLGWISLEFLKKPEQAQVHFHNMATNVKTPMSQAKAWYWLAKTHKALRQPKEEKEFLEKSATFSHTFYGQKSLDALGRALSLSLKDSLDEKILSKEVEEMQQAILRLHQANPRDIHLKPFLIHLAKICKPGEQEHIIHWMKQNNLTKWLVLCTKIAGRKGPILLNQAFPIDPSLKNKNIDDVFLHALVRQESGFDLAIKSPAGACGLMQVMPKLAKKLCKRLKILFHPKKLTTDGAYNIKIGCHFLHILLNNFDQNSPLVLAAYNAGETAVNEWIKDYGDPRDPTVDTLQWIESIPYSETRSYIMHIMESMPFYKMRLGKD
jgi:soluble lytic murein transglycosylase